MTMDPPLAQTGANGSATCESPDMVPQTARRLLDVLQATYESPACVFAGDSLNVVCATPDFDPELGAVAATRLDRFADGDSSPQVVLDEDLVFALAVPYRDRDASYIGMTVLRHATTSGSSDESGGMTECWSRRAALAAARLLQENLDLRHNEHRFDTEMDSVAAEVNRTYEEIALLHRVSGSLRVSGEPFPLSQLVLDWLLECIPVKGMAIELLPAGDHDEPAHGDAMPNRWVYRTARCPLDDGGLEELFAALRRRESNSLLVANRNGMMPADRWHDDIRQLIAVPVREGHNHYGTIVALNHEDDQELGSIEASLMSSVASILGVHVGNCRLYREQAALLESVVRALVSAIDAKDPYTCGHSDRVARISVRLAKELGLPPHVCDTIYMAGLLHDIGKIGVEDAVLRKEGRLTDEEYEQIKRHPQLGADILDDIKPFLEIIPGVLYHHEKWDGTGYPEGLAGEAIPQIARVIAVADSYDAMTSDRPYRTGMSIEVVEEILRGGRTTQWDARVIDAYFRAADDIHAIVQRERAELAESVGQWSTAASTR